jgi:hypothetical protein
MEVQAHLMTGISFALFGIKIPHGEYTMKIISDCSLVQLTQGEMSGTAQLDQVDQTTGAPAFHHILEYTNEDMLLFTRYLVIIDFISYSSLQSTNTKYHRALTNIPHEHYLLPTICLFCICW